MAKAMTNFEAFKALEDIDDVEVEVTPKKKVTIKESINESVDDYYVLSDGNPRHARVFAEIRDIDEFINNIDAKDRKLELSHFVNGKETKIWSSEKGMVEESCKVEEDSNRELIPHFDSRNSFYGKARVVEKDDGTKILYSYATPVCKIKDGKATLLSKGYLGWNSSQTTLRHVKEFLKQNGFDADSLKQLEKNYPQEQAVNEDYQDLDFSWNDICQEIIDKVKEVTGKEITADDIHYDDSRAYSLYVLGDKLGLPVYKFGAYRNYLGGGMQGPTCHNGREKEGTVELGEFFAEKLDEISNILMEPSEDESENESLKESTQLKENNLVNLNDEDEVKDAKEKIESEEKEEPTEKIIDADAETIDKTKESYLGDAVLICHKCRRTIFKKPEELIKDEKSELYNIEDICPNCGAQSGYELGGQIADINAPDKEDEEDVEVKEKEEVKAEPEPKQDDVQEVEKEVEVKKEESLSNFEEIDNEGIDKLLTEHLTSVYENVESFTTKNAEVKDNSLMLEGVIKYKSGKEKNTSIVFEDCKIGKKKNKVKLIGKCEALSKSNKALSFLMKSEDNKLFCESLFCNYDVKVNDEEKIVRGRYLNK